MKKTIEISVSKILDLIGDFIVAELATSADCEMYVNNYEWSEDGETLKAIVFAVEEPDEFDD
ncbi:hypothetical protein IQ265_13725 [Nodosilinea sp. LEGE 06152]|uniref:hypothetical protein n=1 Tax=Nodosilinea sp. LEGE 06152 TaxID=2777966 RepID=UPI001882A99A|nr:hypothetical protein [Nodosilinea sp. LEGE 06152]MBE9157875.1 hypothetical protein [Nodosilinea sp. LEGE 06152]